FREKLGFREGRILTIFGYVTPEKGYDTALAALAELPPPVKLLIAGGTRVEHERAYMDSLQEDIRARGLSGRVAITGYLEEPELAAAMAVSDLVLVPHTVANGSYSVMIALGYGKAVLASDLACFREIHEQGGGVELFEAGDERSLAERLGFLLASASARKALAGMAAEYAASRSWASVADRTRAVYEQVLRTT
ncbi:MAG TPA: glycosyltransferase family 4 protein, partial [Armatimonadota bacterium]|nr:glycosyltransferase family 4 protein [Armatimonadota bacterium]